MFWSYTEVTVVQPYEYSCFESLSLGIIQSLLGAYMSRSDSPGIISLSHVTDLRP